MSELEVIYDPVKEFAAIIDIDTRQGWGPAFIGPNAGNVLQLFVDSMPFDVAILDGRQATQIFVGWLEQMSGVSPQVPTSPPVGPLEPPDGDGLAHDALAQAEAAAAGGEPPEPQPADADMDADASATATLVVCPLCSGQGNVVNDETGEQTVCGMCQGSRVVPLAVTP